jgi:hypothetical protein
MTWLMFVSRWVACLQHAVQCDVKAKAGDKVAVHYKVRHISTVEIRT